MFHSVIARQGQFLTVCYELLAMSSSPEKKKAKEQNTGWGT